DTAVVNVSLPHIAGSLMATIDESTWVLTSYLAATAVILPISGWLANFFGRRRLMLASIASFTLASLLCGLAPNLGSLIAFRIIQGMTGGVMMPLSQSILLETFPPQERGKAMAFWSMGIIVAPIFGPMIGGYLTLEYNWRWVFYVNVPVGLVALVMTDLFVFDPPYVRRQSRRIDYLGIGLLVAGIGALQVALDKGQEEDWFDSRLVVFMLVVAVAALLWFCVRELQIENPVVDLRVFRSVTFTVGAVFSALLFFILFGSMILLPIFLQTMLGYSALQAGLAMAPRGLGSLVATPIVGLISDRVDSRKLLALGLAIGAVTTIWLSRMNLDVGFWDLFWPQFLQGCALGLLFVPLTVVNMSPISKEAMGNATSVYAVVRNVGSSVGIATVATVLARSRIRSRAILNERFDPFSGAGRATLERFHETFVAGGIPEPVADDYALAAVARLLEEQAQLLSFVHAFELLAVIFICMAPMIFMMRRPQIDPS
ncbi:MAG: DHA2 family efflux MFS transporter permease subunit, partial [Proteobacteria bacterium]|nr:DHA2 family efflux MFS transporter permease subunit [Pseudomonadota bacterium]